MNCLYSIKEVQLQSGDGIEIIDNGEGKYVAKLNEEYSNTEGIYQYEVKALGLDDNWVTAAT